MGTILGEVEVDTDHDTVRRQFINTASLGATPEWCDSAKPSNATTPDGLSAIVAMARTLRHARPLRIRLNGETCSCGCLFVGNGTYAQRGHPHIGPRWTPACSTCATSAPTNATPDRFLLAVVTNTLATSHVYAQRDLAEVDVVLLDGNRRIATDGESGRWGIVSASAAVPAR